ncbi:COR domain-containing protein [Acaryochloris thomasi]|uniref:COR domain-containing protein n=1 Tax=Acaryochloris thomasi TaxID=2929456 RepID=UPI0018F1AE65|nr:COR domain-containing protein [Acaryochloris thomasi]
MPASIGQLVNLATLRLDSNQLTTVPPELGQLFNLTELDLGKNRLTTVPSELGQLANLTQLDLYNNQLTTVPPELGQLANLTRLDLRVNRLITLPPKLGQLANLTTLDLYRNWLTTVPPELGQLANLTQLDLYNNQLTTVPPELGQLANLTQLNLANNQLTTVPPELGQLANLTQLNLANNQLTTVPSELGQLANLTQLDLANSGHLVSPPPEVLRQGTRAILTYLREQQEAGERQWLSKLLVVGEGGVGKTSLLRALRGESFQEQQSSTHGIDIQALNLEHPNETDVTMTLNTWDFGGQEIYHATHQFFLTNRSLFLLTFNARLGYEQGKLIYWLKTIRANAPESPIILVATWTDERDADLPLSDLKQQFPQIRALLEVSNKTGNGVQALKQSITQTAADLPLMGELWPKSWLQLAQSVRQEEGQYTTPKQLWEQMKQCNVSKDSQSLLATYLHELGDILFFQDNPELNDLVILKPQWVTQKISKVLSAEAVIEANGIFTRQCMEELWHDLHPSLRDHFLELMEQFDLSYKIPEDPDDKSLVVERLEYEPPEFQTLWQQKQQEPNCKEISIKFQLSEILAGIPTWFIARQHRFTQNLHWRTGVLFGDHRENPRHLGLLRVERDTLTNADYVRLTVRGPMPHSFFDVLREGFELTLSRYPGLKITRLIPCPDPIHEECKHEFNYANLIKRLERTPPIETISCEQCLENISVTRLLFGLHYTTQDAVIAEIEKLRVSNQGSFDNLQNAIEEGFTELRELVQRELLREIRAVQKQLESPCPSVFVLRPDDRSFWQKDIGSQRINLQLYCEHPGCFHPVQNGGLYAIDNPKKWLKAMAPHLNRLFGILKYVTPVVGPWLNISAPVYSELIKNDLALSKALIDKLPEITFDDDNRSFIDPDDPRANVLGDSLKTRKISGAALRTLNEFLKRKDPDQVWGGLTRTKTPEGDVLWLCQEHIKEIYPSSR